MFKTSLFYLILFELAITNTIDGQRFGGGLKLAGTLSQIDGDNAYGFHRAGFEAGVYGRARLSNNVDLEIDFSYNQRGSLSTADDRSQVNFKLNYIDIPVLIVVKDWLNSESEKKYYHMHFFGGLSLGYLISSSSLFGEDEGFRKSDLSWILGASYFYTRNWGVTAKYTRSITPLYTYYQTNTEVKMISYFISLGLNYKFN